MNDPRTSYREAAGRGATGVRLVILLYEQVIHDLRRAISAIEQSRIEERTREINHALSVIGHLQCTLDTSVKGAVTQNLANFYQMLRSGLVQAQAAGSREILQQQISHLLEVREAWEALECPEKTKPQSARSRVEPAGWKG